MGLRSWVKKLKNPFKKAEPAVEEVPANWAPSLLKQEKTELQTDGTIKVIYEDKRTRRYFARHIKRFITVLMLLFNFIMFVTCFFVEGGIMAPFFGINVALIGDYYWKTRPQPLEEWK